MSARESIGQAIGKVWAPAVAAISRARHARMFHPRGHTFAGYSTFVEGPYAELGRELSGRVLARCSAALWKGGWEHFDVLGMALRFRSGPGDDLDENPRVGDQDLLTATIRSPLTMLASPFLTDASDFAGNKYWAVSPFEHHSTNQRFELRLVPDGPRDRVSGTRVEKLAAAVYAGQASWWLQARKTLTLRWHTFLQVELDHEVNIDQEALAFDPFHGALEPVGVVHSIRRAVYASSQHARPRLS